MTKKSTHVVPNSEGGWDIKQSGGQRSSGHFDKKQDAVDRASINRTRTQTQQKHHEPWMKNTKGGSTFFTSHVRNPRRKSSIHTSPSHRAPSILLAIIYPMVQ